jgi:uncharacterized Tic20 family protein
MNNLPSTEERVWAVLSHLSAIAFGMGILLPIIGWSEQRRKSKYASFQCLQALGYQSLGFTFWLLSYLLLIVAFVIVLVVSLSAMGNTGNNLDTFMGIWTAILVIIIFGTLGLYFLLPVIAAIACALGKDFRYPIMGKRLAHYLGYDSNDNEWLSEDHEDCWVAAMGHFSVIIALWGMLAPLSAWILQGGRSLFLKFQSIQTLVYQVFVTLLFFGGIFVYIVGAFFLLSVVGLNGSASINTSAGMTGLVVFLVFMLVFLVIILIVPLFHIMGQWAGYRVLKGDNYHYPLLGNLVEKQISKFGSEENIQ